MTAYRTGNHQPRNLYRGDEQIGVCFDPADTALIVDALEGGTPDSSYLRGATEALAAVRQRLTYDGVLYPADAQMLRDAAAEVGVETAQVSASSATQAADPASGVARSTPDMPEATQALSERADVRRRIAEQAEHRPSSLGGDGLGYGPCVGCGKLWPCTAARDERTGRQ